MILFDILTLFLFIGPRKITIQYSKGLGSYQWVNFLQISIWILSLILKHLSTLTWYLSLYEVSDSSNPLSLRFFRTDLNILHTDNNVEKT